MKGLNVNLADSISPTYNPHSAPEGDDSALAEDILQRLTAISHKLRVVDRKEFDSQFEQRVRLLAKDRLGLLPVGSWKIDFPKQCELEGFPTCIECSEQSEPTVWLEWPPGYSYQKKPNCMRIRFGVKTAGKVTGAASLSSKLTADLERLANGIIRQFRIVEEICLGGFMCQEDSKTGATLTLLLDYSDCILKELPTQDLDLLARESGAMPLESFIHELAIGG